MTNTDQPRARETTIQGDHATLGVSFELSQSSWVLTTRLPGSAKISRYSVKAGDTVRALALLQTQRARAERQVSGPVKIVSIQEAGLDGFWVHRWLEAHTVESHVVDAASIAAPRLKRRAKSDGIDGETQLRTLSAWQRGEPRVCSMVAVPSVAEEDRRQVSRERAQLISERIALTNRVGGRLASQGIRDYDPLKTSRHERLEALRTGGGRALPAHLKAEIVRMLDRIELLIRQIAEMEARRDALLQTAAADEASPAALLLRLCGIGPECASVLWLECLYRQFTNRRQVAAYAGLAPSPRRSGSIQREQGISKSGNPRLRKLLIELAWLWLRYQPGSALSRWFRDKTESEGGRIRRIAIVALARKLLVALWRYVKHGVVPDGAKMKTV